MNCVCVVQTFHSIFMNVRSHTQDSPFFIFSWVLWMQKKDMRGYEPAMMPPSLSRISIPTEVIPDFLGEWNSEGPSGLFSMKWRSPKVLVEKLYAAKASAKKKCVCFFFCQKSRNKMRSDLRNKVLTDNIRVRLTPINVLSSPEIRDNGCE